MSTMHRAMGALIAFASLGIPIGAAIAEESPGILWQTTSQTVIEGMPFSPPPNTTKLCAAREWNQPPPPPSGQSCTVSNFQRSDNKVSWDTQCTGEMEMSGHGEITFTSADAYTGTIEFAAEGMSVTVNLTGEKIGECDNPVG
jgi:Protein of unknown function (DUF3617)